MEKVLVVDDEPEFLELAKRFLVRENLEVLTALDGQQGLEIFKQNPSIPVLVTDYNMPNMNGAELIKAVKELSPQTQAILISAFLESPEACKTVHSLDTYCVIPKPINFEYLINTIKSAIQ